MFGYRVPRPDEAMLVSGGSHQGGVPFKVIVGRGGFVPPGFRKALFITLALQESEVAEPCVTKQGITLNVRAVIAFKVGSDQESIVNAGQRFLSDQNQMPTLTGRIFAGHLRSIVGSMTVEEIVRERQRLAEEVLDASKIEMAKIGLVVDSLQIQEIDDGRSGYIDQMSKPHMAAVARDAAVATAQANQAAQVAQANADQAAKIAQANARQAAAEVEQESLRRQSDYAKQTAVVTAQNDAAIQQAQAETAAKVAMIQAENRSRVDAASAQAAQAGPLAQARAQQEVAAQQAALAVKQAELREQQLLAEVVKPAEAEAAKVAALAEAEAKKVTLLAEAAASGNRVNLDQQLIAQLPAVMASVAQGLNGSNLTVLNGSDGLAEMATGLVTQVMAVFAALRQGVNPGGQDSGGMSPSEIS